MTKPKKKTKEKCAKCKGEKSAPETVEKQAGPEVPVMAAIAAEELSALREELKEANKKYLLTLAESENVRKRLIKEKYDHTKFTIQDIIIEFLPPLDQFEKALQFADGMSDDVKNWAVGFSMILEKFKEVLHGHGIMIYHTTAGETFDPHLHEALETVETHDSPDSTILEELSPGYKMGDRVIRPAHVKVAKTPIVEDDEGDAADDAADKNTDEEKE
ncbi:MAG: nucleotide exchange factor GrpE [Waddliaceae bacterium]|jgi:molecular chaperone GrpE|nr:nucleotide exchange factor GrpE [Waddliaceae bacterium]MBT3578557.1 nucleotide exchange factor GrpE [Waddliaceae bacterium]MBT4444702.1 nucleotide exchange factor GrpE [Waddliaceae bacterium]MBT6928699.1 nucleotide exchange factor GrpE [Waddliaceae bacterium]MBT7264931.1 nucleotide exchange factor GrpE [Waddliaceae bacterium]